jgi:hypothetical protein
MISFRMLLGSPGTLGKIHLLVSRNSVINIRKGTDRRHNKIAKDNLAHEKRIRRNCYFGFCDISVME